MHQQRNLQQIILILTFVFTSLQAFALTVEEAVQKTLNSSDEIGKIEADVSSIKIQKTSNFAKTFLPEASLGVIKSDVSPDGGGKYNQTEKVLSVGYNVSGIYKGSLGFAGGIAALNSQKFMSEQEKINLTINVIKTYFSVLETEKSIELLEKSLNLNQKLLEQITNRFNSGSVKRSSVLLLQSQVEEISANIELTKNKLYVERNKFFSIVGVLPQNLEEPIFPSLTFTTFDDFQIAIKENNLGVKIAKNNRIAAKYNLAYQTSDFLPDISLSYQKYSTDVSINPIENKGSRIVISAKLYLYKPGLISSVIQKGYEYRSLKYQDLITNKDIENNARDLWSKYEYYNAILPSKERLVKVRTMLVKDFEEEHRYGRIELTDTLEEERKLTEAQLDLLRVKFQKLINIFEIKSIAGEKIF